MEVALWWLLLFAALFNLGVSMMAAHIYFQDRRREPMREKRFAIKSRRGGEALSMSWVQPDGEAMPPDDRREIWLGWETECDAFLMRFVRVGLPDGRTIFSTDPESWE